MRTTFTGEHELLVIRRFVFVHRIPTYGVPAHGMLKNYNTIEEFKAADKTALFNELSDEVRTASCHIMLLSG